MNFTKKLSKQNKIISKSIILLSLANKSNDNELVNHYATMMLLVR